MTRILLIGAICFILVFSGTLKLIFAADEQGDYSDRIIKAFTGKAESFSDTSITIKNKKESAIFRITEETMIEGKLKIGCEVSVTYYYLKIFKAYGIKKALVIKVLGEKK